jgi:hypothetical protein
MTIEEFYAQLEDANGKALLAGIKPDEIARAYVTLGVAAVIASQGFEAAGHLFEQIISAARQIQERRLRQASAEARFARGETLGNARNSMKSIVKIDFVYFQWLLQIAPI